MERVDQTTVRTVVENWPEVAREAARTVIEKYGLPDEASPSRLIWHNNGPWRRTVLYGEEVKHNFPTPHVDVLEQYIPYHVPLAKIDELAAFDGSVLVDRTKGELSARCEGEEANFLALNLANDIVEGRLDVSSARNAYAEAMKAMTRGESPEITRKLQFDISREDTGVADEAVI